VSKEDNTKLKKKDKVDIVKVDMEEFAVWWGVLIMNCEL
jgi:hypothetical protein